MTQTFPGVLISFTVLIPPSVKESFISVRPLAEPHVEFKWDLLV